MSDAKKGTDGRPISRRDAAEWFVDHESDRELDEVDVVDWEQWCTWPRNDAEYVGIVHLHQQLCLLPAPSLPRRGELLRDALADRGAADS